MGVEVVGLELHKLASVFDIDGAPKGISSVDYINRVTVPVGFTRFERDVLFMKAINEYCTAGA